jgi:cytochrome P450 family 26 subfamily A
MRRIFTMFFGPEGLQNFVPRMCALAKSNLAEYWDGKDHIQGVSVVKEFTFAIAANLFVSVKQGDTEFHQMSTAVEDYLGGILQVPLDLPGTVYHKARLAREVMLRTLDPIIKRRQQVGYKKISPLSR